MYQTHQCCCLLHVYLAHQCIMFQRTIKCTTHTNALYCSVLHITTVYQIHMYLHTTITLQCPCTIHLMSFESHSTPRSPAIGQARMVLAWITRLYLLLVSSLKKLFTSLTFFDYCFKSICIHLL